MIKKCVNCFQEYECYDRPNAAKAKYKKYKRTFNSVTCSPKCSKEYHNYKSVKIKKQIIKSEVNQIHKKSYLATVSIS